MSSTRCILSVRYTAIGGGSLNRRIGGVLRYVQNRDHHDEREKLRGLEGFLRYAAHRDHTAPEGRLFGAERSAGTSERQQLGRYITASVRDLTPAADPDHDKRRACYRFVISPEDGRGVDLRRLTREVMGQLARDAGSGGLPPWIAAEHRNTAHPHVHVVMAARRQLEDGRYRTLIITGERLQRMKGAMNLEMERQRGRTRDPNLRDLVQHSRGRHRSGASHSLPRAGRALDRLLLDLRREAARDLREWERQQERDDDRELVRERWRE